MSQILNELVQPSRHILLEPNQSFHPYLHEKLVKNSPSKGMYDCDTHISALDGYNWESYYKLVEDKILEPVMVPPSEGLNTSLLFVGNLLMKGIDGDRFLAQIVEAIGMGHWIHRYGRVRMLLWVPDSFKIRFLPRVMKERSRMSVTTQICADVTELAGEEAYYEQESPWYKEISAAHAKLQKYLAEVEEKKRQRALAVLPPEKPVEAKKKGRGRKKKVEGAAEEEEKEEKKEEEKEEKKALQPQDASGRRYPASTLKQMSFNLRDHEQYLGKNLRSELEQMYSEPGHKPWTPELEHPPWLYDSPDSPIPRPAPPPAAPVVVSQAGRKRRDGEPRPTVMTTPLKLHQPLVKNLRRLPLPDEYTLNGYDAWQLLEARKHHQSLDKVLEQWEEEVQNRDSLPLPPDEKKRTLSTRVKNAKEQYLTADQCEELGFGNRPNFQKTGLLLSDLKEKFNGDEEIAMAWLKALGISKRKRSLVIALEEEDVSREILQWHKRKKEPIIIDRADIHPMEPVALIDVQPKQLPDWIAGEGVSPSERMERWEILSYLLRNVYVLRSHDISDAVSTLGPGAEQILEGMPGLKDGKERARVLAPEVYVELAKRYEVWPFRDKLAIWTERITEQGMMGLEQLGRKGL